MAAQMIMMWNEVGDCVNAHAHTANQTLDLIGSFGWKQLDHPLYSPVLGLNNYHLFLHLKIHLGGQCHDDQFTFAAFQENHSKKC